MRTRSVASDNFGWADEIPKLIRAAADAGAGADGGRRTGHVSELAGRHPVRPVRGGWHDRRVLVLYSLVTAVLFVVAATTLIWMIDSWRTPWALGQMPLPGPDEPRLSFSLIVPARHEEAVLGRHGRAGCWSRTTRRWRSLVVVGDDDPGTAAVAHGSRAATRGSRSSSTTATVEEQAQGAEPRAAALHRRRSSGSSTPRTRSRPSCSSTSTPASGQTHAHVVQGGVQLMNYRSSWWSLRNVLEYFFWFPSRLHFHARSGFIPLGGNTVFVRTDLLRLVGGWDADCLAEDCELGVRLSAAGARVARRLQPGAGDPGGDAADAARASSSSAPAGTRATCRCCARASGAGCRPAASG